MRQNAKLQKVSKRPFALPQPSRHDTDLAFEDLMPCDCVLIQLTSGTPESVLKFKVWDHALVQYDTVW